MRETVWDIDAREKLAVKVGCKLVVSAADHTESKSQIVTLQNLAKAIKLAVHCVLSGRFDMTL